MTNSTLNYWDAGGQSLETLAWGIDKWGTSEAPPPSRGGDLVVPHRVGQIHRDRVVDGRTITLAMWVTGAQEDGTWPADPQTQFDTNWSTLRGALWNSGRPFTLTKRWNAGASSAAATAVFVDGLDPTPIGDRVGARFTCDLQLADPYFYAAATDSDVFSIGSADPAWTGNAPSPHVTIRFSSTSSLTNPSVTASIGATEICSLTYTGTITSAKYVEISLPEFTWATDDTGQSPANFTPTVPEWWINDPNVDDVTVAADSGTGTATITYLPAYV